MPSGSKQVILSGTLNAFPSGLSASGGTVTCDFTFGPQVVDINGNTCKGWNGNSLQAGQVVVVSHSYTEPSYVPYWQANTIYPYGALIADSNDALEIAIVGGISGSTQPSWPAAIGTTTLDNQGSGYSSPPVKWLRAQQGISWNFDGLYHITGTPSVSGSTGSGGTGTLQFKSASQYNYFNPNNSAPVTGGSSANAGAPTSRVVVMIAPEPVLEYHTIQGSPTGLVYQPTVAYTQGIFVVSLNTPSDLLTSIYNAQQNPNQLFNPQLFTVFARISDSTSYYGVNFNGLYQVTSVISPTTFTVQPPFSQYVPNDYGGGGICEILASMSTQVQSGMVDISYGTVETGGYISDDTLTGLSYTSKYGGIREETFDMGFYRNGDQVKTPISPVDGYAYSYDECNFEWTFASSSKVSGNAFAVGGPSTFTPGTLYFPALSPFTLQSGETIVTVPYVTFIDQTGNVTCEIYTSIVGVRDWGVLRVVCHATRESVPIQLPANQLAVPH